MRTYTDICESIGYDRCKIAPKHHTIWRAYKNGTCQTFVTEQEAKQFSKLVERVVENQKEIDEFWKSQRELEKRADGIWYSELEEYWSSLDVTGEFFDICYSEAYDRAHSSGRDEIASVMHDVVNFAEKIRNIK